MALSTCTECKNPVSTLAASCPHCGAPPPNQSPSGITDEADLLGESGNQRTQEEEAWWTAKAAKDREYQEKRSADVTNELAQQHATEAEEYDLRKEKEESDETKRKKTQKDQKPLGCFGLMGSGILWFVALICAFPILDGRASRWLNIKCYSPGVGFSESIVLLVIVMVCGAVLVKAFKFKGETFAQVTFFICLALRLVLFLGDTSKEAEAKRNAELTKPWFEMQRGR